jgi:hypothetical protein
LNPNSNTLEPDQQPHDRPAACVIAQHYSSATFVSLRLHFRKQNLTALFKNVLFQFYAFF